MPVAPAPIGPNPSPQPKKRAAGPLVVVVLLLIVNAFLAYRLLAPQQSTGVGSNQSAQDEPAASIEVQKAVESTPSTNNTTSTNNDEEAARAAEQAAAQAAAEQAAREQAAAEQAAREREAAEQAAREREAAEQAAAALDAQRRAGMLASLDGWWNASFQGTTCNCISGGNWYIYKEDLPGGRLWRTLSTSEFIRYDNGLPTGPFAGRPGYLIPRIADTDKNYYITDDDYADGRIDQIAHVEDDGSGYLDEETFHRTSRPSYAV